VKFGNYLVRFSFIGYKNKYVPNIKIDKDNQSFDFSKVEFSADQEVLESVEITVDKPVVTYEIDKKVVNVENMTTVVSATALEVLQNIPSITVDMDGKVRLRGSSGFTLLIDNKPANMDASDALQMIPASNIKDIEIITNPSAKYNAEGTAGIINIILKKDKLEGISTLINVNGGNFNNYGGDILVSVNKKKVKFNIGGNYKNANRYRDIYQLRETIVNDATSVIEGEGEHRFFRTNYGVNTALEYTPNRKNTFSLGLNGNQRQYNAAANYFFTESLDGSLISSYENRERTLRQFYGLTISGGYTLNIKGQKDHRLSLTGMYNYHDGNEDAGTEYFDGNGEFIGGNRATEIGPSRLMRYNLDYERPLKKGMKFKTGLQTDIGNNSDDQDSYIYSDSLGRYERMDQFSTDVSYLQNVYAGYGILSGELKKLGYQIGIRGEYTDRDISITTGNLKTAVNRMDWFPSAHFSYQLDKKNQFMANASRRIQRPRSWYLEPFITWEDPYTVRTGNADLLPEYIQSFELGYIRNIEKGSFSTELYFRNTNNIIERVQEVYTTNVILKRPVNAGTSKALGGEISYRKNIKKWWSLDFGTNIFWYQLKGQIGDLVFDQENFTYNARLGNTFNLKKDWKIQLVGNYNSPRVNAQGMTSEFYIVDLAIKKDFWEKKLSTSIQLSNVFNTEKREDFVETPNLYSYRLATPKWPIFTISASLRLNNYKQQDKIDTIDGDEF
jgi:outer membrane receptor protein involved in Fe transport